MIQYQARKISNGKEEKTKQRAEPEKHDLLLLPPPHRPDQEEVYPLAGSK
jgi:hypothetical protein